MTSALTASRFGALDPRTWSYEFTASVIAFWGVSLLAAENQPFFMYTSIGTLLRSAQMVAGLSLLALLLPRITAALNGVEVLALGVFFALVLFASVNAYMNGQVTSPASIIRTIVLTFTCFLVAKSLDSEDALERYFRIFYMLCLISSIQGIISFVGYFEGYRTWWTITIQTISGPVVYPWHGLLGIYSGSPRIYWYFSEPAHYAQMLLPGFFYAMSRGRRIGSILIGMSLLTTAALATLGPALLLLLLYSLRRRNVWPLVFVSILGCLIMVPEVSLFFDGLFRLAGRGASVAERVRDYNLSLMVLENHPLGYGLIDIFSMNIVQKPSSGLAQLILIFGALILPHVGLIIGYLGMNGLGIPRLNKASSICLALLGVSIATISAGPWFKYWMVFMLGALINANRIHNASAREARAEAVSRLA